MKGDKTMVSKRGEVGMMSVAMMSSMEVVVVWRDLCLYGACCVM